MKTVDFQSRSLSLGGLLGVTLVLSACGGGSSSDNNDNSVIDSTLDTTSVQTLAGRMVLEGDCSAVSGVADIKDAPLSAAQLADRAKKQQPTLANRISSFSATINGLLGGSLVKSGEHSNGTDTLNYAYTNFSNPVGDLDITANGNASVVYHGTPGEYGPVYTNKTVDVPDPINISKAPLVAGRGGVAQKSTANYKFQVSGLKQVYATVLLGMDDLTIASATLENLDTGKVYKVSDVKSKGYFNSSQVSLSDLSYTYTTDDVGTLKVKSDSLIIQLDGVKIPKSISGTLTMTATDGTQAETVINGDGTVNIYRITTDGKVLTSEVDCSGLVH